MRREKRARLTFVSDGPYDNSRQRPTLPHTCACSTIGGGRLNFRVRNGNGCDPAPMTTGKLVAWGPAVRNAAISHVSSHCRSSQTICNERITTEYPANGSSNRVPLKRNYGQASRRISTSQLNASLRFHTWPINLVVYQEPLEVLRPGRSHLVEGFTLRCLQRFSLPDVATRRCRWRDNRYTRGPSNPVLSY